MSIEQTLMRSMKTSSDLTSDRGFQNSVLIRWLIGTPVASTINDQIEKCTNIFNFTSEQHVDQRDSQIKIDNKHINILSNLLNYIILFGIKRNYVNFNGSCMTLPN